MDLAGRVAAGAGSDIGQGLAVGLAKEGMKLVLAGCNRDHLEVTADLISNLDVECICAPADVSHLMPLGRGCRPRHTNGLLGDRLVLIGLDTVCRVHPADSSATERIEPADK